MDQQNISDTFLAATLVALGFKILQVKKARILYYDRICRSYLQIYPEFSKAVDDIYQAIVDSLQKKSLVQLPGLMNKGICIK